MESPPCLFECQLRIVKVCELFYSVSTNMAQVFDIRSRGSRSYVCSVARGDCDRSKLVHALESELERPQCKPPLLSLSRRLCDPFPLNTGLYCSSPTPDVLLMLTDPFFRWRWHIVRRPVKKRCSTRSRWLCLGMQTIGSTCKRSCVWRIALDEVDNSNKETEQRRPDLVTAFIERYRPSCLCPQSNCSRLRSQYHISGATSPSIKRAAYRPMKTVP